MVSRVSIAKVSEINKGKGPKSSGSSGHGNSYMSPFGLKTHFSSKKQVLSFLREHVSVTETNLSLSAFHTGKTQWTADLLRQFIVWREGIEEDNRQRKDI